MQNSAEDRSSVAYVKLAQMASESREMLWILRPKMHAPCLQIVGYVFFVNRSYMCILRYVLV